MTNQTKTLYNKTITANKQRIAILNTLYSNEWNIELNISSDLGIPAPTIKEKLQNTLKSKGFPASSYKMFVAVKSHCIHGYVQVLPDAKGNVPISEFINAVHSMTGLYNISCFEYNCQDAVFDITDNGKYTKTLRTFNIESTKVDFAKIICTFISEFMDKRNRNKGYTQNYELTGTMKNKQVTFIPQINSKGNGYVWFYVNEYNKKQLKHQCFGAVVIRSRKPYPALNNDMVYLSTLSGHSFFVYVIFRKSDWALVYTGYTRSIETRAKRHFAPTEAYSNNTSVPFNYDFWLKNGTLPVNKDTMELFKKHRLSHEEYEIRFLPLYDYDYYVNIDSEHDKSLLPEAYIMNALYNEVPEKIVYAESEMTFFCNKLQNKACNVPLWHSTADLNQKHGSHNINKLQVDKLLNKYSNIVNREILVNKGTVKESMPVTFEYLLRSTLQVLLVKNLEAMSWYEIFKNHALTLEQAVRLAVTGKIDSPSFDEHKEAVVNHILKNANYRGDKHGQHE